MLGKREIPSSVFLFTSPNLYPHADHQNKEKRGKRIELKITNTCKLNLNDCLWLYLYSPFSTLLVQVKLHIAFCIRELYLRQINYTGLLPCDSKTTRKRPLLTCYIIVIKIIEYVSYKKNWILKSRKRIYRHWHMKDIWHKKQLLLYIIITAGWNLNALGNPGAEFGRGYDFGMTSVAEDETFKLVINHYF